MLNRLNVSLDWAVVIMLLGAVLLAASSITGVAVWVRLLGEWVR